MMDEVLENMPTHLDDDLDQVRVQYAHPYYNRLDRIRGGNVKDNTARASIAFTIDVEHVEFGISFCSPSDVFKKRVGRELAEERLTHEATSFTLARPATNAEVRRMIFSLVTLAVRGNLAIPGIPEDALDLQFI